MRIVVLLLVLVLQSFAYAGPICGNHLTAAESMACCESGHQKTAHHGITDSGSATCCGNCDLGTAQVIKRQEQNHSSVQSAVMHVQIPAIAELDSERAYENPHRKKPASTNRPEAFLLNQSFLI